MHKFALGDMVEFHPNAMLHPAIGAYEITMLLPIEDRSSADPSYKVRSSSESYLRVALESQLNAS